MLGWPKAPDNLKALDKLAVITIVVLVASALLTFLGGVWMLNDMATPRTVAITLLGFAGSAVAAVTSCLDRYATGFELDDGSVYPENAKKERGKFSRRFARWLWARPFLGAIIANVFIWGITEFAKKPDEFLGSTSLLGFTAFMGGLLAKSVVDLIKNLFKNVFRA